MSGTDDRYIRTLAQGFATLTHELDNPTLPTQTAIVLLQVMLTDNIPMGELERYVGLSQAAISRNVDRLGPGKSPDFSGARVIEAYEDPSFRTRKLVKLTPKGVKLKDKLVEALKGAR